MTHVSIDIGSYTIQPHELPDGRVEIEVSRMDTLDAHDHPVGPHVTIDVGSLFATTEAVFEPDWHRTRGLNPDGTTPHHQGEQAG